VLCSSILKIHSKIADCCAIFETKEHFSIRSLIIFMTPVRNLKGLCKHKNTFSVPIAKMIDSIHSRQSISNRVNERLIEGARHCYNTSSPRTVYGTKVHRNTPHQSWMFYYRTIRKQEATHTHTHTVTEKEKFIHSFHKLPLFIRSSEDRSSCFCYPGLLFFLGVLANKRQ
jgi:hypothetical protein